MRLPLEPRALLKSLQGAKCPRLNSHDKPTAQVVTRFRVQRAEVFRQESNREIFLSIPYAVGKGRFCRLLGTFLYEHCCYSCSSAAGSFRSEFLFEWEELILRLAA